MRRALLILVACAAVAAPAAALAARSAPGDGTLVVRGANGDLFAQPVVQLAFAGAVVGQVVRGRLVVLPTADAGDFVVTSADGTVIPPVVRDSGALVYSASNFRFKAVGGRYRLMLLGRGIDLNVVGQGSATLDGSFADPLNDGWYALNGGERRSLPAKATALAIGS